MRALFLKFVTTVSVLLTRLLIWRYRLEIISVAGSVGKTTTKHILGDALNAKISTIFQKGSFNQPFSIPFAIFGLEYSSSPTNIFFWIKSWLKMIQRILWGYSYKIAVVEVGSDHPGDIAKVTRWLKPNYAILTAVSEEHMANFRDLDEVAVEEFGALNARFKNFIAKDSIDPHLIERFLPQAYQSKNFEFYGFSQPGAKLNLTKMKANLSLGTGKVGSQQIKFKLRQPASYLAEPYLVTAKILHQFKFSIGEVESALKKVSLPAGRLQVFKGIKNSTIIDDTYNASPSAYKNALDLVYKLDAKRRIIVLGNMNEFGAHSKLAHQNLAKLVDLSLKEDVLITIGPDANKYLFAELKKLGAKNIFKFKDPWSVGEFINDKVQPEDLIFLKGSQNGVFLEEAVRPILADLEDEKKLCRQSQHWQNIKLKFKQSQK